MLRASLAGTSASECVRAGNRATYLTSLGTQHTANVPHRRAAAASRGRHSRRLARRLERATETCCGCLCQPHTACQPRVSEAVCTRSGPAASSASHTTRHRPQLCAAHTSSCLHPQLHTQLSAVICIPQRQPPPTLTLSFPCARPPTATETNPTITSALLVCLPASTNGRQRPLRGVP
jgi:hypothetical protein